MNWTGNYIAQPCDDSERGYNMPGYMDCELCGDSYSLESLEPFEKHEHVCRYCIELNKEYKSL